MMISETVMSIQIRILYDIIVVYNRSLVYTSLCNTEVSLTILFY